MGLSIEEFLAGHWPADTQLVDGEVIMSDPSFRHQEVCARIFDAIRTVGPGALLTTPLLEGFSRLVDALFTDRPARIDQPSARHDRVGGTV